VTGPVLRHLPFDHALTRTNTSRYPVNERCLERFPPAADLIMGALPRYEPHAPDCALPWREPPAETRALSRRRRR
jgi:hypothetical protein